jgi:hypothetical protein
MKLETVRGGVTPRPDTTCQRPEFPNFRELEYVYVGLSAEDQRGLLGLIKASHVEPLEALQMFIACENNLELTARLLESSN